MELEGGREGGKVVGVGGREGERERSGREGGKVVGVGGKVVGVGGRERGRKGSGSGREGREEVKKVVRSKEKEGEKKVWRVKGRLK